MVQPLGPVRAGAPLGFQLAHGAAIAPVARTPFVPVGEVPRIVVGSPTLRGLVPALPLPDATLAKTPAPATVDVAFFSADPVDGDLTAEALRETAQTALREAAERHDQSPARLADEAEIVPAHRRPSRNAPDAVSTLRIPVLARDSTRDIVTVDVHLARTGESLWEAVAFDRAAAARTGSFPYAEMPLARAALQFDPRAGQFAVLEGRTMLAVVPATDLRRSSRRTRFVLLAMLAGALVITCACAVRLFA